MGQGLVQVSPRSISRTVATCQRGKNKKPPPFLSEQGRLGLVADQSAASASSGTDADMEASVRLRSSLNASVVNFTTPSAVFAVS